MGVIEFNEGQDDGMCRGVASGEAEQTVDIINRIQCNCLNTKG